MIMQKSLGHQRALFHRMLRSAKCHSFPEKISTFVALDNNVMAVHGHRDSKTSDVYTKTFNHRKHTANAMPKLAGLDW